MSIRISDKDAEKWRSISLKITEARKALDDAELICILGFPDKSHIHKVFMDSLDTLPSAYMFMPQTEWIGGDSGMDANHVYTKPHVDKAEKPNPRTGRDGFSLTQYKRLRERLKQSVAACDHNRAESHDWEKQCIAQAEENERLREALIEIRDSKYCQYENTESVRRGTTVVPGQYGIGVTDGHRFCSAIAQKAMNFKQ